MVTGAKRWLIGYAGTWFILALMSESKTAELASALAVSVAVAATFILGPDAARSLGVSTTASATDNNSSMGVTA